MARSWLNAQADPGQIKRFRSCPRSSGITDLPVRWPGRLLAIVCAIRRPPFALLQCLEVVN